MYLVLYLNKEILGHCSGWDWWTLAPEPEQYLSPLGPHIEPQPCMVKYY